MVLVPSPTEKYVKFSPGLIPAIKYIPTAVYEFGTELFISKPQCEVSVAWLCTLNPENRAFWELC